MPTKRKPADVPEPWYRGANIPMRVIRRFARDVAERFAPEKIILFGSYAYGIPHDGSDVDILVVMPCRNELDQSHKIHWTTQPPFPLDIVVRKPKTLAKRLKWGDWFLREVVTRGKVLYDADHKGVGPKRRGRSRDRASKQPRKGATA